MLTAVAFAYLARALGPRSYGYLEFTLALIFVLALVVDLGLGSYGAREIARAPEITRRLAAHLILLRCGLAVVAYALILTIVGVLNEPPELERLIRLYGLTLLGLPFHLRGVFQGREQMQVVAVANVVRWSVFVAGVFVVVREPAGLPLMPAVEGTAVVATAVLYLVAAVRTFGLPLVRVDAGLAWRSIREALPIGASELVWALKLYFATLLLGVVFEGPEVAWFGSAHRIVIALHTFVWLYFFNLLPSIARCSRDRGGSDADAPLRRLLGGSMRATAWTTLFGATMGSLFAGPLMRLVYGAEFTQAGVVFRVLVWLVPLALVSGHYRYTLIGYDRQRLEFVASALGAALNLVLNLTLVPRFGIAGAAWSLLAAEVAIWALTWGFVRRFVAHVPIERELAKPIVAVVVVAGVVMLLQPVNIWLAAACGAALYLVGLLVLQADMVRRLRGRRGFKSP